VLLFPKLLIDEGVMERRMLQNITHEIDEEIQQATHLALHEEAPAAASALKHLYSETVDITSEALEVTLRPGKALCARFCAAGLFSATANTWEPSRLVRFLTTFGPQ